MLRPSCDSESPARPNGEPPAARGRPPLSGAPPAKLAGVLRTAHWLYTDPRQTGGGHKPYTVGAALGPEDGEDLVGVREPGLDEPRLLRLAATQFGHRAQHEEPVERFLVAVIFDVLQRRLAPERVVPGDHGVVVEAVGFDVGMEIAGAAGEEGMGPASRGDEGDAPGARRQDAGKGAAQVEAALRRRPWRVEVVLL